jgi:DNA-directed RNA polymerase subunit L
MKIKIEEQKKGSVKLNIDDEDHIISDIVHHELLKDKKTSNAGTLKIHPLLKKNELLINSDSSINNILDSNIDNAIKISAKLKSEDKKNSVKK